MTINIISPHASNYFGGMEVVTINMALGLAKIGVRVRFFTRKVEETTDVYKELVSKQSENLTIIEVPVDTSCPLPYSLWATFYRISCDFGIAAVPHYKQYSDADIFITHLSVDTLFVPKDSYKILHLHGNPGTTDPLMQAAIQLPDMTIAHSQSIKDWWAKQFNFLEPRIFLNGVDTTFFKGEPKASRDIDVLYVGRLIKHKGVDDVLKAVSHSQKVAIAGHGPHLPKLKYMAEDLGLTNVTFYESPSTSVIRNLYKNAKIFVCPSRSKEGVLTTLLEASASGCAVITTSGSGMTDLVTSPTEGIIVSPGDISALKDAINTLLGNNVNRIKMAETLQAKICQSWTWQAKSIELEKVYRGAL